MNSTLSESREVFCPECEAYREVSSKPRQETYTLRGEEITVSTQRLVCEECGTVVSSDEEDQSVLNAVHAEYRLRCDLLTPERIKNIRKRYRLSQKSFAALLGMSEATINRYEKGGLQDQAHDTAIRACENVDVVRDLLDRRGDVLSQWQRDRVKQALEGACETLTPFDGLGEGVFRVQAADEMTERTGFRKFDYGRYAAAVAWFCLNLDSVSRTVINKLLFYADFLNFQVMTTSLTGTAYRAAPYGPVPTDFGMLLDKLEADGVLSCEEVVFPEGHTGYYYRSKVNVQSFGVEFSPQERRVLDHVASEVGKMSAKDVSEKSHEESAYKNTRQGELISYREAAHLSLSLDL